jgi:hypothetical protein
VFARDLNVLGKARNSQTGIARAAGVENFQMLLRRQLQPLQRLAEACAKQPEPRRVEAVVLADDFVLLEVDQILVELVVGIQRSEADLPVLRRLCQPGDLLLVEAGNTVPADARLIQSTALLTAEASLTGESLPVSKDKAPVVVEAALGNRYNMIFSGTAVIYGRARAVVTATGMRAEIGRIAGMLTAAPARRLPCRRNSTRLAGCSVSLSSPSPC